MILIDVYDSYNIKRLAYDSALIFKISLQKSIAKKFFNHM